jgi:PEP-CTERM motif
MTPVTTTTTNTKTVFQKAPLCGLLALVALLGGAGAGHAQILGPTAYLAFDNTLSGAGGAISPFSSLTFTSYFHLETFEDGLLNTPGVSASVGSVLAPGSTTDSVDADDGNIDGSGILGNSLAFSSSGGTISFTFNGTTLGGLPTHAGIVWTDGAGAITFDAFDGSGTLIGSVGGTHADGNFLGGTAEDRFYGIIAPGGIGRISIRNATSGIEVDHLQYGRTITPEPSTLALLAVNGIALFGVVRRKRQ